MLRRTLLAAIANLLPLSALAQTAPATQPTPFKVVATFSILGDFAREVGGSRVDVTTLVGANGDAHVYAPSPSDARKVAEAGVVIVNGLKFEGWIEKLIKASGTKAAVVTATTGIKTIKAAEEKEHGHSHGHSHGAVDPHAWQNASNAKIYVANIRDALIAADPAGKDIYTANASAYTMNLDTLDAEIKAATQRIPVDARRVITSHDAFGYFAAAYGLTFTAPRGVSTEAEASAQDVARIIRQIKAQKARAVFVENISDPRLSERIAKETGARIGGRLYSDALSASDGPAGTYIDMMRHNIKTLSAALTS